MEKTPIVKPEKKQEYVVLKDSRQKAKISLWLDDYDNLFSDFDPRSFSHRELSDDFLNEAMKFTTEAEFGKIILIFLIPTSKRNITLEKVVKVRMHNEFQKRLNHLAKEKKKMRRKGYSLGLFGVLLMIMATVVASYGQGIFFKILLVILEPAGWFTAWYGLDHIFYFSQEEKRKFEFYHKLSEAEFKFDVY